MAEQEKEVDADNEDEEKIDTTQCKLCNLKFSKESVSHDTPN